MPEELTVVVSSCDKYADLLRPFSVAFQQYWPDCRYPRLLVTESAPTVLPEYIFDDILACGKGVSWCARLLAAAKQVTTPYMLLILDDFFLCDQFSNIKMEQYLKLAQKYESGSLRLVPLPAPHVALPEQEIGEYKRGEAYRVCAQVAIWDTAYLIALLSETPDSELWEFERRGSFLSESFAAPMLGTYRYVFPYTEIICAGKWLSSGLVFCSRAGIEIDESIRPTESDFYLGWRCIRGGIFKWNPTLITKLKNAVTFRKKRQ